MTHDFIYHNPTKVYFGNGMLAHLPEEISRLGSRVLLITGGSSAKKSGLFDKVLAEISKANVDCYGLSGVKPNPEIGLVREGIRLVRENAWTSSSPSAEAPSSTPPKSSQAAPPTTPTPGTSSSTAPPSIPPSPSSPSPPSPRPAPK